MDSQRKAASSATATSVDQKVRSVTNMGNVHAMTTSKDEHVTGAKRTSTTGTRDAWTARRATIWCKMMSMSTA